MAATTASPSAPACRRRSARCSKARSCCRSTSRTALPSARFTGDSFVLPSTARRGIPVVTVNMDVADIKLFRIGDRSLAQLLSGYQFLRQLDSYDIDSVADPARRAGLGGRTCHRQRAQQGSHHQLPGRRGAAQPQARRLCADRAAQGRPHAIPGIRAPRSGSSSPTSASPPIPARTASTSSPARSAPPSRSPTST